MLSLLCGAAPIDLWRRWKKNPKKSEPPFPLPSLINLASPPPPNRANPTTLRETERKGKRTLTDFCKQAKPKGQNRGGEGEGGPRLGTSEKRKRRKRPHYICFLPPPPPLLRPKPRQGPRLVYLGEVIVDLRGRQHAERPVPPRAHDGDLDVVARDLPLKALLQRQESRVDGVLDAHVLCVALLEEGPGGVMVFSFLCFCKEEGNETDKRVVFSSRFFVRRAPPLSRDRENKRHSTHLASCAFFPTALAFHAK